MHTYIKIAVDCYSVGMWLPNPEGVTHFVPMFDVTDFNSACRAVSALNGGTMILGYNITKEH